MILALICLACLYLAYRLRSQKLEDQFGINMYRVAEGVRQPTKGVLGYRHAQLAQIGLTFGVEGFFGVVFGVMYGPLAMIWCILGSALLGCFLNYYCGMYAVANNKSILSVLEKMWGYKTFITVTVIVCLLLMIELGVNYVFLLNILSYAFAPSPLWYLLLFVVIGLVFMRPKDFMRCCSVIGAMIILTTLIIVCASFDMLKEFDTIGYRFDYPSIKNVYPVMFFTINVGVLSGVQALKCTLMSENLKNERMGRGVFMGTALFQTGIVILLILCFMAWNPYLRILSVAINQIFAPDVILYEKLVSHTGKLSYYALFITMSAVCILSAGSLLRLGIKLCRDARIFPKLSATTYGLILFIIAMGFLIVPFNMYGFELISMVLAVGLMMICLYLRRLKKQSIRWLLYAIYFFISTCVAYFPIAVLHLPLRFGILCGASAILLILIWHYYYYRKKIKY
ncbi:MAG: hypothetical protein IJ778_03820 [Alphaproteobacteria bacterium]|nr:hypothetical protein [Alphaproteobacteria bacterium]